MRSGSRGRATLGSALFLLVAPGVVAGLVPWLLTGWETADPPLLLQLLGALLIVAGTVVLLEAFVRFVVEGEGVWTVVGRDPVAMRRGDFLPQAGWNWHAHHNATDKPMAWIDGLDIPFQYGNETQFFEFGRDTISDEERITPARSRSERLWAHPGLTPVGVSAASPGTPLLAYRWENTDRADKLKAAVGI